MTRRSPPGYGSGRSSKAFSTLNTVVFAPMAMAKTSTVAAAYSGRRASARAA
ncbi:MAG TPA: hypothetical protein VIN61_12440 [Gammaproteobacteria bacterium]